MYKITIVAVLSLVALPAAAADLIIQQPIAYAADAMEPGFDWSGGFVGASVGYAIGNATFVDTDPGGNFFDEATGETLSTAASGFLLGVSAGYNWQFESWVLGVEAELGAMNATGSNYVLPEPDNFGELGISGYGTLTGRVGMAFDNVLVYAKGGVVAANVYARAGDITDGTSNPDPTSTGVEQALRTGWTVGAGAEYAFDRSWSARAEYQYFDLGSRTLTDTQGDTASAAVNAHVIKAGVNFRFW